MLWLVLFFAPAAFGATEWWSRAVLEGLIFGLAAMCALRRDFSAPARGPLLGFGAVIVLGLLQLLREHAVAQPAGLLPFTVSRPQTLYSLLLWSSLAALFWSASGILRWEGAPRRLAWAVFGTGLFIAFVGVVQRGQGNTAYYGLRAISIGRPFGPFTNPNHAADWLAASSLVGAGLFVESLGGRSRAPLADRAAKSVLAAFVLCASIAAVVATGSRGGIHALFLGAFLTAALFSTARLAGRTRGFLLGGLALAALGYVCFLSLNPKWIGLVGGAIDRSAGERLSMYRSGLRLFSDFPVFGVGLGGLQRAFLAYKDPAIYEAVDHIHNSWFEVALEAGAAGAAVFLAAFLAPLWTVGRRLAGGGHAPGPLLAGYFAAALAVVIHGVVEFTFQIPANAAVAVVLMAAVTAGLRGREPQPAPVAGPRRLLAVALFSAMAVLSLPPGLSGARPRLGAPFIVPDEPLLAPRRR